MASPLVAFVANGSFALPLSVAIRSLGEHRPGTVAVVYDEFDAEQRTRVERATPTVTIEWVPVPEADRDRFPSARLHRSTWYRILLPRLFPDADRIVYLDADIVVADDVSPLLDVDLGGHALGAVQNLRAPFVSSTDGLTAWDFLGLEPAAPYFNAGVLVLDAARWRAEDLETASIEMAHRLHDADLLPMADQDTLNALFADDWQRLDPRWNQHPLAFEDSGHHHTLLDADALQRLRDDPAIVHFIGRDKPWLASSRHPFRSVWRDHVATAAFGDFRPEAPSTTDRIVGRLRRAGQALTGR